MRSSPFQTQSSRLNIVVSATRSQALTFGQPNPTQRVQCLRNHHEPVTKFAIRSVQDAYWYNLFRHAVVSESRRSGPSTLKTRESPYLLHSNPYHRFSLHAAPTGSHFSMHRTDPGRPTYACGDPGALPTLTSTVSWYVRRQKSTTPGFMGNWLVSPVRPVLRMVT